MPDRYYSADPIEGPTVTLGGSEAHHLLHVVRAKAGLPIILFDGHGGEFEAEIAQCNRTTVDLAVGSRQPIERELPFQLTLAVALPKGDRQRWLVEKLVELGATRLIPLRTVRSVRGAGESTTKLTRYVIEASKQCGRNRLMEIGSLVDLSELLEADSSRRRVVAHPGGRSLAKIDFQAAGDVLIAVGPEGGFTEEELSQSLEAGWEAVDLGNRILRVETAAIALASVVALE